MREETVLAQLIEQAAAEGCDVATARAIAEEAGAVGAARALARLGLEDGQAGKDMAELRELLGAWRDAKRSAVRAVFAWAGRMVAALLLVGLAVKLGFPGWLK